MMDTENSKVMKSPLRIEVKNYSEFQTVLPDKFQIMKEILEKWPERYKKEGKVFDVIFK